MFSLRGLSLLALAMASMTSASPIKLQARQAGAKRLLLWDYTNTNSPEVAARMDSIDFENSQLVGVMNWNSWYPSELKERAPFQPMVHNLENSKVENENWGFLLDRLSAHPGSTVHFFNEPDLHGPTPQVAADIWNSQMVGLRNDFQAKLVTPAVASNEAGTAWLNEFMGLIGSNPPDFLGLHYYGPDAGAAMQYFRDRHTDHTFPVIVSEVGARQTDAAGVDTFTKDLTNQMDNEDFISQYAWFGAMTTLPNDGGFTTADDLLMNQDGSFKTLLQDIISKKPL